MLNDTEGKAPRQHMPPKRRTGQPPGDTGLGSWWVRASSNPQNKVSRVVTVALGFSAHYRPGREHRWLGLPLSTGVCNQCGPVTKSTRL